MLLSAFPSHKIAFNLIKLDERKCVNGKVVKVKACREHVKGETVSVKAYKEHIKGKFMSVKV